MQRGPVEVGAARPPVPRGLGAVPGHDPFPGGPVYPQFHGRDAQLEQQRHGGRGHALHRSRRLRPPRAQPDRSVPRGEQGTRHPGDPATEHGGDPGHGGATGVNRASSGTLKIGSTPDTAKSVQAPSTPFGPSIAARAAATEAAPAGMPTR